MGVLRVLRGFLGSSRPVIADFKNTPRKTEISGISEGFGKIYIWSKKIIKEVIIYETIKGI